MNRALLFIALFLAWSLLNPSAAQLSGHNTKGDFGLQAGTQPPPGWYLVPMYYDYSADKFLDKNGDRFLADNDGFAIWPSVTNNALEFPPSATNTEVSTGLADLYVQPNNLGWNTTRADFTAGLGVFVPTGEYAANGTLQPSLHSKRMGRKMAVMCELAIC